MGGDIGGTIGTAVAIGGVLGAAKEAWKRTPVTVKANPINLSHMARGVIGTSTQFAIAGALYAGGENVASGIRNKEDSFNSGLGGAFVGMYLGMQGKGSLHSVVYKGIGFGCLGVLCAFTAKKCKEQSFKNSNRE
jgi:hypothetical protein